VSAACCAALIGAPLRTTALARERMRRLVAPPVLPADAPSSVASTPDAMLEGTRRCPGVFTALQS
jgi:hypothetical protein